MDGLRGIAALTVVAGHAAGLLGDYPYVLLGRLPVMVFFVLSGYVLALPYLRNAGPPLTVFAVKRFFRIYPPYAAVALLTIALLGLPSTAVLAGTFLMSGTPTGLALNLQAWSLVVEIRLSTIYPIVLAFLKRYVWVCAAGSVAVSLAIFSFAHALSPKPSEPIDGFTFATSMAVTVYYLPLFVAGGLLARFRDEVRALLHSERRVMIWAAIVASLGIACVYDPAIMVPATAAVAAADDPESKVSAFLATRPVVFLGKISYSLYLVQGIVIVDLLRILHNDVVVAAALAIPVSIALATALYRFVEVPSIGIGRTVGWKIAGGTRRAYSSGASI